MSTTAVTPASAPAAAAAPAAAPAAASTPVSTPSTSSTPAGGGDGGSPSSTAAPDSNLSTVDRLAQGWAKARAADGTEAGTAVAEPEVTETEDQPEIGEVTETEPGEDETAVAGEGEEAAETTEQPADGIDPNFFDDGESLGPQSFMKEVNADPAVEKFFNEHPELKNKVCAALRRDTENREIRQFIPDVETAKTVTKAAATFQKIDNHFQEATTPEGAQAFLNNWVNQALITDDAGNPVMENGKYKFHPALPYTLNHIFENKLSVIAEEAQRQTREHPMGNERLMAALDVLREETSPSSPASGDIPDELKPQADALTERERAVKAKEDEHSRQVLEQQKVAHTQSIDRAESKAADSVQGQLKPLFAKSSLSVPEQEWALGKIGEAIDERLGSHDLYQSIYDSILKRPPSEEREKALTAHLLKYTNQILGPIATKVIRDAKSGAMTRQDTKQSKVGDQTRASKSDPKATSVAAPGGQPLTLSQIRTQVVDEYKRTHNGDEPETSYVIAEGFKRFNAGKRK
jgi:hypothetical protein